MQTSATTLSLLFVLSALSCTGIPHRGASDQARGAIVGEESEADFSHEAVVAVRMVGGDLCSGTVIQRSDAGERLHVLTAAHCCRRSNPPSHILVGPDRTHPTQSLSIASFQAHPCFNPYHDDYDVCVLTVVDRGTPPLAPIGLAVAPDRLEPGMGVTAVGYGSTPATNTLRRRVEARLSEVSPLMLAVDQRDGRGGICFGDSGGPFLIMQGSTEVIAGVISFAARTALCNVIGGAGRVSFPVTHEAFLNKVLLGEVASMRSLFIRRTTVTPASVGDTYLDAYQPERNFGDRVNLLVGSPPAGPRLALLRFDLSELPPGARILTAQVGMHQESWPGPGTVTVHRVTRHWDEHQVTWTSFGENSFDPVPIASVSSMSATVRSSGTLAFDVTELVQDWGRGCADNHGILLRQTDREETQILSSEIGRASERPWLHICYKPPSP